MLTRGQREVLYRRKSKDTDTDYPLTVHRSFKVIIQAASRRNKQVSGIYASTGSSIAARHGRGIRLIILIAPSTPFLCSYTRIAVRTLNFILLAAISTYNRTS